ncbi:nitroreductase family deazaflavin-dependent oxidoreductase [Gammaproteobacteria bacterium]|jgi:deazaflavin-dependent oxidoreductase (nitroreductase family)|nr:nitroreductase family deazaflavin-dependent oxidoreductase [Gammaproteobacteria bacterium]MDB9934384.1 nitroreductase family deazaflavin-dependent oxidoreductase [Gammaproteobacteria bacterium]MDC0129442.1 nitroreductase family deazaflavin-dependent oxidoreductase [Gammaproteobacteria bacterium]
MSTEKYTAKQAKTATKIIKYFAKFQARIFLLSKGKLWNKWSGGFHVMVVRTKGAKTDKIRNIPLIYVHQDGMPILVASLGGMPKNPNWYYNVKAHPNLKISTIHDSKNYIAEEVSKEKKDELWPLICSFYPDYETYQNNTSRDIPVFLCRSA